MSVWRRKAIECLPECKREFELPDANIYTVFFELLPATHKAHKEKDVERLKKYYDFAEWCFRQKKKTCGMRQELLSKGLSHKKYVSEAKL